MGVVSTPVEIVCCYSLEDETWRRKLETHLSGLKLQGLISFWHHRRIAPGTDWAIDTHLETASVILLLVSADFLASDYCYGVEMKRALAREAAGEARVVPIPVRPVDWKDAPFAHLQALPPDAKPLSLWRNQDAALTAVTTGIRRVIEGMSKLSASAPRTSSLRVPYERNPFFCVREELLNQLHERLRAGKRTTQAISGLGGIGKTQLAVEYAYRYHQDYEHVLWALAKDTETLISSFTRIAQSLKLPEREAQEPSVIIDAVRDWLQTHEGWFMILDNADELDEISHHYLPSRIGGHLLITTQAEATEPLAQLLKVGALAPKQGAELLLRRAGLLEMDASLDHFESSERELAMQISEALGGLPLALDQAGAYLFERGVGLADYWQLYQQEEHRQFLLNRRGGMKPGHPEPVATTFALSFQKVQEKSPAAVDLLQVCAFLAPDAIPRMLFIQDAFEWGQAVECLLAYSLVHCDRQCQTLQIHRLVQEVMRDRLSDEEKKQQLQRVVTRVYHSFSNPDQGSRDLLWPHVWFVYEKWIEQEQIASPESARLLRQIGYYLCEHARYTEAGPFYTRCRDIQVQHLRLGDDHLVGDDHPVITQFRCDLAYLRSEMGEYEDALQLCQNSQGHLERRLGGDHPDFARHLNNQAILCKVRGRYPEAEELFKRCRNILERRLGADHPDVARLLNNLAVLYAELRRCPEAEELFKRCRNILERRPGADHPDVARLLSNQAHLYMEQGNYADAMNCCKHSRSIFEMRGRSQHSDAAYPLNVQGMLFMKQGKSKDAEECFGRCGEIWEQVLKPEHPEVAYSLHNLAVLYTKLGRYKDAELRFLLSRERWEEKLGEKHRHTQTCADNYEMMLQIRKRDTESLERAEQYNSSSELADKLVALSTFRSFRFVISDGNF